MLTMFKGCDKTTPAQLMGGISGEFSRVTVNRD